MLPFKTWTTLTFSLLVAGRLLLMLGNWVVDPYGVLGSDSKPRSVKAYTSFPCTSRQMRTQRPQEMHLV